MFARHATAHASKPKYEVSEVTSAQPSYGVSMSEDGIKHLVDSGWNGSKVVDSIKPVGAGKSFNNKLYFLKLRDLASADNGGGEGEGEVHDAVLKVNGAWYDGDKIQNEVGCLRLLELHCPHVPSPRVLAWSETGEEATFVTATSSRTVALPKTGGESTAGWILSTKLPGEPLPRTGLDAAVYEHLAIQLADIVSEWRQTIPPQKYCGNILFPGGHRDDHGDAPQDVRVRAPLESYGPGIRGMEIRGIVVEEIKRDQPIRSLEEYYRIKLDEKLRKLASSDQWACNQHLLEPLRAFRESGLPQLRVDAAYAALGLAPDEYVFTHYDLFARNLLVTGSPSSRPQITGLVDFEFAGFFPPVDEFLDDWVNDDWPDEFYVAYRQRLSEKGVRLPPTSNVPTGADDSVPSAWQISYWLEKIIENAAPWWLPGDLEAPAAAEALQTSAAVVREGLEILNQRATAATPGR
jgi:hypothetical protein